MAANSNGSEIQNTSKIKRLTTGTIVGLIALYGLMAGGIYLLIVASIMIFFSTKEYHKILKNKGFHPSLSLMCTIDLFFIFLMFFKCYNLLPALVVISLIASFLVVLFKGRQPYIANVATTILGILYGGFMPCHIILLSQFQTTGISFFDIHIGEASSLVVTVFLAVVATDVGGYFFGSKYGKHKLAPIISPKKTIEGSVGGAILAIITTLTGGLLNTGLSVVECIILGIITTVSAQLGDLSESLIKRDAGVKDSSDILPGHGGFLDRVDSYMFAIPMAYYYLLFFTHGANIFVEYGNYIKGFFGG